MRSSAYSSVALLGALASSVSADSQPQSFVSTSLNAPFLEQFNESWESRWSASSAVKQTPVGGETFSYVGVWSVEEPTVYPGISGDKGLVIKSKAAHHAISAEILPSIKIEEGKPLVVQYETKLQKGLECGGAYVKLLSEGEGDLSAAEFSDKTPFTIMFGPDKCGATNKVHFIFKHLNPKTGEYDEKHLTAAPSPKITKLSALYTLIVNPDNTFEILINDVSAKTGSLLEDFEPAVNPAKEIDDPNDSKPSTWIDEAKVVDPAATKPAEWDEDAPAMITDTEATKPDGWLENEPDLVADPDAEKPDEWDDEEDGDWIAPSVSNPACEDAPGCGPWAQPMIANPVYKGKWSAPLIDNPEYKGVWAPAKIANPDYFEDLEPAKGLTAIGGVGFEIWTMTEDMLFDNIYIGHSAEDAKKLAAETFHVKYDIERAAEKLAMDEDDDELVGGNKAGNKYVNGVRDVYDEAKDLLEQFIEYARMKGPKAAIQTYPNVAGTLLITLATILGSLGALITYIVLPDENQKAATPSGGIHPKKVDPVPAALPAVVGSSADATPVVEVTTIEDGSTVPVKEALKQRKGKGKATAVAAVPAGEL